jgi:hypothetical protein
MDMAQLDLSSVLREDLRQGAFVGGQARHIARRQKR